MNNIPKRLLRLSTKLVAAGKVNKIVITPETQRAIQRQVDWNQRNKGQDQKKFRGGPHQDQFTKDDHRKRRREDRKRDWNDEF